MDSYCWLTALKGAISNNFKEPSNRYLQLATIRADGTPAVRNLVFRQLIEQPAQIVMVTDQRSEKTAEIAVHPYGEICWYFNISREQFRIKGSLTLSGHGIPDQSKRLEIWSSLSSSAKEQFFWPTSKQPLKANDQNLDAKEISLTLKLQSPPENFLVLAMNIESIDHLCLQKESHTRWLSYRSPDDRWISEAVYP